MEEFVDERKINTDDLIAACNSLGQLDVNDGIYMKDRDCKSCLKEIIRALNNDNKQHTIRCMLGSLNIIKSDIIPLINQYCDFNQGDQELFNLILRLCTNLTSSVLLMFENQEVPNNPESTKIYNALTIGLVNYKKAFANDFTIWETLNVHLRHAEDEVTFEKLLILIRNILHIPVDSTGDFGVSYEFNTHDMILHWIDKSGMLQTIIEIASGTGKGAEFCFHIMEIVYLMLRDKNPITIASAKFNNNKRKLEEDDVDKKKLAELRAREKSAKTTRVVAPRFTRGSAFVVQNYRSLSEAPAILNRLPTSNDPIVFDSGKTEVRKNRNRKPFDSERSSTVLSDRDTRPTKVAYSLKLFCKQFTEKVYANYMQQIKHNLIQKKAAENDESYYLWAIQFFIAFNRNLFMSIDNISETLSTSTLHFIQILINDYQDKLKIEKKRTKIEMISKRLHLAIRAYKEILSLIRSIQPDSDFGSLVDQIKKKIFSEVEYSNMLLSLFQQYDESKHCSEYVKDLIKANEVFLELGKENQSMSHYYCLDVLKAYSSVLKSFKTNELKINLSILTYFEQLAHDHHMEIMLMQASIFQTLLEIIDDGHVAGHERFLTLTKELSSKFVALVADKKRWMFQELLFWKTHNDLLEIEHDPQEEQIITTDTINEHDSNKEAGGDQLVIPGDEEDDEAVVDKGGLSPLSQISGVDDMDDLFDTSDDEVLANDEEPSGATNDEVNDVPKKRNNDAMISDDAQSPPSQVSRGDDLGDLLDTSDSEDLANDEERIEATKNNVNSMPEKRDDEAMVNDDAQSLGRVSAIDDMDDLLNISDSESLAIDEEPIETNKVKVDNVSEKRDDEAIANDDVLAPLD